MGEELDDTRPAPLRTGSGASTASSDPADQLMADTVMTSRRTVVDLVEPKREETPRRVVDAAVGRSPADASPATGIHSFRVDDYAQPVMLDMPARIGRDPHASRISTGIPPRLVRVSSPNQEVSGTHLEVRQVGSSVVVTDLRSTNGSVVMQPGSIPRKLRQGESVVVSPGALVDIGDGNILQILPMQRLG